MHGRLRSNQSSNVLASHFITTTNWLASQNFMWFSKGDCDVRKEYCRVSIPCFSLSLNIKVAKMMLELETKRGWCHLLPLLHETKPKRNTHSSTKSSKTNKQTISVQSWSWQLHTLLKMTPKIMTLLKIDTCKLQLHRLGCTKLIVYWIHIV